jgi:hypothetical protein
MFKEKLVFAFAANDFLAAIAAGYLAERFARLWPRQSGNASAKLLE